MLLKEVLIFFSFLLFVYSLWKKGRFIYLALKIPSSSFGFGNLLSVFNSDNKHFFKIANVVFRHNKIVKTWIGHIVVVHVTNPEDIQKVLTTKYECIDKPFYVKIPRLFYGSILGPIEMWRNHRKILNPYFAAFEVKKLYPLFDCKSKNLVKCLEKFVEKDEFDVLHYNLMLSFDTILNSMELDLDLCNQDFETQSALRHSLEIYLSCSMARMIQPWLHPLFIYKLTTMYKRECEGIRRLFDLADQVMENIEQGQINSSDKARKPENFIRALMSEKNNLSDIEVNHEILSLLIAGADTTAVTLSTILLMLAIHKDVQDKVFNELQQIVSSEDLSDLPYLDMVINETMRLFPAGPYLMRTVDEEIELGGYKIPVGADLVIPIMKVHRNVRYWGDDADDFKPERFESENFKKIHPYAFLPFSRGPRMCLGYRFATQFIKIHLANFLRQFEVETSLKFEELDFQLVITMTVSQGYQISLKERKVKE